VSRSRREAPGAGLGWLTTLGGAAILLAFGFGVGLVGGSALDEPDLVAKHLAGEATELPLPAQAPEAAARSAAPQAAQAPAQAEPRPERPASDFDAGDGGEAPPPAPEAVAKPKAAPAKPPAPSAPRAPAPQVAARPSGFAIQVGAFADRRAADELVASLRGDRLRAYVVEGGGGQAAPFRVRVGPYVTREQASDEAARLHARRRLPTWVIAEGGP
jgi:DedD protein